ncbi:MAG: SCO family protein [Pseudomonadota bacterium]
MAKQLAVSVLLGAGILLGVGLSTAVGFKARPTQSLEWLDNPRPGQAFSLTTVDGRFDNQALLGQWTVVVFGFLQCPDICPTNLAQLAALEAQMAAEAPSAKLNYVFVSVDPGRDRVTDVHRYAQHFSPAIRGVTGSPTQLTRLARNLGVRYEAVEGERYTVAHSVTFSIIGPAGALRGRFRPGFDVADLAWRIVARVKVAA